MSWKHERARVAALSRSREPDDPDLLQAQANLRVERLAEHAERFVAESGPLTEEQLGRLVHIFLGAQVEQDRLAVPVQDTAASPGQS